MFNAEEDASLAAMRDRLDDMPNDVSDPFNTDMNETQDNFKFIEKLQRKPIPKGVYTKEIFGVEPFDVNDVLMDNIWNRSILVTDKICREFLGWNIEQMQKYQKRKRKLGFDSWWLILLLVGGGLVVLLMLFLAMSGGGSSGGGMMQGLM